MTWLQSHLTVILTVWGALWALATALQSAFPAASVPYKVVHVVLAVSPLDFMKAIKTMGASLVPPVAVLCLIVGVGSVSACSLFGSPAPAAPDPKAQQTAQAIVSTTAEAWNLAADACMAAAGADFDAGTASNPALAKACGNVLMPIHDTIVEAQVAVSVWDDAAKGNLPCLMASVAEGLTNAAALFHVPQPVLDAAVVAASFGHTCADGGK